MAGEVQAQRRAGLQDLTPINAGASQKRRFDLHLARVEHAP
jgi:hypothetical protein